MRLRMGGGGVRKHQEGKSLFPNEWTKKDGMDDDRIKGRGMTKQMHVDGIFFGFEEERD
jgi:hypothetical protein